MATFNRIDKLRFVKVLRPHIGEQDAEEFSEALEDQFSPVATRADLLALEERLKRHIQQHLILATTIWAGLLAIAVGIAQLF